MASQVGRPKGRPGPVDRFANPTLARPLFTRNWGGKSIQRKVIRTMHATQKRSVALHHPTNVISIHCSHQRELAAALQDLAARVARGEIIGMAYTAIDPNGSTREGTLGAARVNRAVAHYGASRLASLLLWPDDAEGTR